MADRFFEVTVTRSVVGIIRISDDMLLKSDEDPEEVARELAEMDDQWERGTRMENTDDVEIIDVTTVHKAA